MLLKPQKTFGKPTKHSKKRGLDPFGVFWAGRISRGVFGLLSFLDRLAFTSGSCERFAFFDTVSAYMNNNNTKYFLLKPFSVSFRGDQCDVIPIFNYY